MVVWWLTLGLDRIAAMRVLSKLKKLQGFTLIELILTMLIISALAVYAYPRFFDKSGYSEFTLQARLISALRHMQQRAMQDTRAGFCYQINLDTSTPAFGPPKLDYSESSVRADTCSLTIEFEQAALNPEFLRTDRDNGVHEMSTEGVTLSATARNETAGTSVDINFVGFSALGVPIVDPDLNSAPVISCINTCKITLTGVDSDTASVCIESQGYIHACQ